MLDADQKRCAGANSWVEIDRSSLERNIISLRQLIGEQALLMAVLKANAYGHGTHEVAQVAEAAGVNWFGVFALDEAIALREMGFRTPILVFGPTSEQQIAEAHHLRLSLTVASVEAARAVARSANGDVRIHLKVETGTNRQGLKRSELKEAIGILETSAAIIEGIYTHFADIEDTTEHAFAEGQLNRFNTVLSDLSACFEKPLIRHTACSAATILFPSTYFEMARVGIALYGLWPSRETLVSAHSLGSEALTLRPVLTWKTRIAQIKSLDCGEFVGYGRTYRTTRPTQLAVLPVGYSDGYDRHLSGCAHVLVRGIRAPVRGRICMNVTLVDVTDVPNAQVGDEVVLLGSQGDERVSAEDLARLVGTINYEIVTRIAEKIPRVLV